MLDFRRPRLQFTRSVIPASCYSDDPCGAIPNPIGGEILFPCRGQIECSKRLEVYLENS